MRIIHSAFAVGLLSKKTLKKKKNTKNVTFSNKTGSLHIEKREKKVTTFYCY